MKQVLFVHNDYSHFIRRDVEILESSCRVLRLKSSFGKTPLSFTKAFLVQFFSLLRLTKKSDVIYCWFADYHSFLPAFFSRMYGKPFYLVLGGYDVADMKEYSYGSFSKKSRAYFTRYSLRKATCILPVARALGEAAVSRVGDLPVRVMPTCYDPEIYTASIDKENIILSVSVTSSYQRYMIKGLDRFTELAIEMPDYTFVLIGIEAKARALFGELPANLQLLPPLAHQELLDWYGKAKFYAQFSRSEGLPNAICESMLRSCIPICTRVGGIPEASGTHGILIDDWDAKLMARKVSELKITPDMQIAAREHIIKNFHVSRREKELTELINA